jgi:uncharacterized LabA/DUF88 family protein
VRGRPDRKQHRQKAVDVQLAVDLLVASVDKLFKLAILVTGDADFVPAAYEAKRRGVRIVVAGFESTTNGLLIRAPDRFIKLDHTYRSAKLDAFSA